MQNRGDSRNLLIAIVLSLAVLLTWQFAYEMPRKKHFEALAAAQEQKEATQEQAKLSPDQRPQTLLERADVLKEGSRVPIDSPTLHGSIALKGLRFNDLRLAKYHQTVEPTSPEVVLLSPARTDGVYFTEFGWISADKHLAVPTTDTVWNSDKKTLSPGNPVMFWWDNNAGLRFSVHVSIDQNYMFAITQQVDNHGTAPATLMPYALINRAYVPHAGDRYGASHEGVLNVLNGVLGEVHFKDLKDETKQTQAQVKGWVGLTDKYWLTALVPDTNAIFTANASYYQAQGQDRYQADILQQPVVINANASVSQTTRMFAGAKEIDVLDSYVKGEDKNFAPIALFDRAVDFGMFYFLAKPFFLLLNYFYHLIGNFGIAILLLTVVIKAVMFPLANKSYKAMNQMKRLQPEMARIRERSKEDKLKMNQEIMGLYKREKVNPASGCLPMLIQLPVFFSLYKVLYVTIEMRHAPFFGWIRDLSAPDPTNIFTLFGLIPWNAPSMLHIGIWPLIMFVTMLAQQKMNPKPTDPVQAQVMSLMPWFFLFILAPFPAGLVIYWAWNNTLSVLQQWVIGKLHLKPAIT